VFAVEEMPEKHLVLSQCLVVQHQGDWPLNLISKGKGIGSVPDAFQAFLLLQTH
jgi:hypothetical protein